MSLLYMPAEFVYVRKTDSKDERREAMLTAILAYLSTAEPKLIRALKKLWTEQREQVAIETIQKQLNHGMLLIDLYTGWYTSYQTFVENVTLPLYISAMEHSSQSQLSSLQSFSFNTASPTVLFWLTERSQQLADQLTRTQVNGVVQAISGASKLDYGADELAQLIHGMIGVTPRQAAAIERYYDVLRGEGAKADYALRKAQQYARKSLGYRAQTITRTELSNAYNEGSSQAVAQAQSQGLLGNVNKEWVTMHDERVCPLCGPLDGVIVGRDELFPSGFNAPGAHTNCRCVVLYSEVR